MEAGDDESFGQDNVTAYLANLQSGDAVGALRLHRELMPLVKACFFETNPIPVKTAAALMGLCTEEMRLPMTPMSQENKERLRTVLQQYGLIA